MPCNCFRSRAGKQSLLEAEPRKGASGSKAAAFRSRATVLAQGTCHTDALTEIAVRNVHVMHSNWYQRMLCIPTAVSAYMHSNISKFIP